ncbi:Uncharacterised protein [Mycobacteroides abscessus]|nr:Uncharacterised protein [Mycobacteroides abscessus]
MRIEAERIAAVLAVRAQGVNSASIIGRRTNVHHKTVRRILDAA